MLKTRTNLLALHTMRKVPLWDYAKSVTGALVSRSFQSSFSVVPRIE